MDSGSRLALRQERYLRPQWYLPLDGPPIAAPVLDLQRWQLCSPAQSRELPATAVTEWPDSILMPGLVNSHTHLDLAPSRTLPHSAGVPFAEWIGQMIRYRRSLPAGSADPAGSAVATGLAELEETGTAAAADVSGYPWPGCNDRQSPVRQLILFEQLGLDRERADSKSALLRQRLEEFAGREAGPGLVPGISPHAPYSMDERLFEQAIATAESLQIPVAMHIAESPEERLLLDERRGPFAEMLESAGLLQPATRFPPIQSCLAGLARCRRALVIHGNYLLDSELDFISGCGGNLSIVWCPRTHRWFGHSAWPLEAVLQRGIPLAIGTDSRASSPDLDLLAEMKEIARTVPQLDPRTILSFGSLAGARALGWERSRTGRRDLPHAVTAFRFGESIPGDPESAILALTPLRRAVFSPPGMPSPSGVSAS